MFPKLPDDRHTRDQWFSVIDGKEYTAWTMADGNTMVGVYMYSGWANTEFKVVRPDGSTCYVPADKCRPATADDIESAVKFFESVGRYVPTEEIK